MEVLIHHPSSMLILFLHLHLLLLQSTWDTASSAQPPSESGNSLSSSTTSTISVSRGFTIFLLVVAVGFFLSGIVFVLFRHILGVHFFGIGVVGGNGLGGRRVPEGLSQEAIEGFPTYFYEDVKVHRGVDADLECAICLSQFQDHEVLRLLPKCNHIFHPECIDPWLHSQATCPVCRSILEPSDNVLPTNSPPQMTTQTDPSEDNHQEITIMDPSPPVKSPIHPGSYHGGPSEPGSITENRNGEPQIVLDRFTLRLPEEARCKLESTKWRFAKASSGRQHFRSKTPESGRIELNGLESEPDRISLSSLNRNWKAFVSQPASPLQTDSTV